jgi:hypothetical protein
MSAPRKFVQTLDEIVILYENNANLRQIFMDGRSLAGNDPQPWWYGYSVGKWQGNTLVVETIGFRDGGWLDIDGSSLTDQGKVTERFHRVDYGPWISTSRLRIRKPIRSRGRFIQHIS